MSWLWMLLMMLAPVDSCQVVTSLDNSIIWLDPSTGEVQTQSAGESLFFFGEHEGVLYGVSSYYLTYNKNIYAVTQESIEPILVTAYPDATLSPDGDQFAYLGYDQVDNPFNMSELLVYFNTMVENPEASITMQLRVFDIEDRESHPLFDVVTIDNPEDLSASVDDIQFVVGSTWVSSGIVMVVESTQVSELRLYTSEGNQLIATLPYLTSRSTLRPGANFLSVSPNRIAVTLTEPPAATAEESLNLLDVGEQVIYVVDIETGEVSRLGEGVYPQWSPDGRYLAYKEYDVLYIYAVETGEITSYSAQVSGEFGWSPDSTQVAYLVDDHIDILNVVDGNIQSFEINAEVTIEDANVIWMCN